MANYKVNDSSPMYQKHLRTLRTRLKLTDKQILEVLEELEQIKDYYESDHELPGYLEAHVLEKAPWTGFWEIHVMDDVLLVHVIEDKHKIVRFVGLYNHQMLSSGKLD